RASGPAFSGSAPDAEEQSFMYGKLRNALPYLMQDGYDRERKSRVFSAAVLENEHLKATFLPEVGGRLWSLFDKDTGRELLYVNPVFQPANLAFRNAWVSGGVEWNSCVSGHTPFTVSPLFAAAYSMSDGTPVLRMYEWERIRRAAYQVEAYLPSGSKFLFIRPKIVNTLDRAAPMYWWSNIAVKEAGDVRVIAPADQAYMNDYNGIIGKESVPVQDGVDKSYTTRASRAMDWFFAIPEAARKWECAVDGGGYGLIQASTEKLIGRKLFLWGNSPGGRRWQEFLSTPGSAYLEIQAGLAPTQMQYVKMPPNAEWDWLEAYGALQTAPEIAHGEWNSAYAYIAGQMDGLLPGEILDRELAHIRAESARAAEAVRAGSGWGALEAARAAACGEPFDTGGMVFPKDSISEEQEPWLALLKTGAFPEPSPESEPSSYMTQPEWLALLKSSIDSGKSDHWYAWLQLGVLYFANGQTEEAENAFRVSFERRPNAWALRNTAALLRLRGDLKGSAQKLLSASRLLPQKHIAIECGKALIAAGMYGEFKAFEESLPQELRRHGRIRVNNIEALIHLGELERALTLFEDDLTVNDVREGEILLSDLWILLQRKRVARETGADEAAVTAGEALARYPMPGAIDFRMGQA
ncbi:MAG: DUF5107 domain-containing protein, partial [Defluviitaleaceae bacterium]|nr:DUF5107 domain-containing protein [Defluviitaleaceae bacterium]